MQIGEDSVTSQIWAYACIVAYWFERSGPFLSWANFVHHEFQLWSWWRCKIGLEKEIGLINNI